MGAVSYILSRGTVHLDTNGTKIKDGNFDATLSNFWEHRPRWCTRKLTAQSKFSEQRNPDLVLCGCWGQMHCCFQAWCCAMPTMLEHPGRDSFTQNLYKHGSSNRCFPACKAVGPCSWELCLLGQSSQETFGQGSPERRSLHATCFLKICLLKRTFA